MSLTIPDAWELFYCNFSSKQAVGKTDLAFYSKHVAPFFKDMQLSKITTKHLLQFRCLLESKQLSPQTIYHCMGLVRRIFNKMRLIEEYNDTLPIFLMPKYDNRRVRVLTKEETDLLLCNLQLLSPLWHDITKFALNTGLRAGEIFNLRCDNVNLPLRVAYIFDTKNSLSRITPLNKKSICIVEKYLLTTDGYMFNNNGKLIHKTSKFFNRAVKQTKLNDGITDRRQKIVFHSLRHTFASRLTEKRVPVEMVSNLLGHKTIQQTLRYVHMGTDQKQNAVELLDDF